MTTKRHLIVEKGDTIDISVGKGEGGVVVQRFLREPSRGPNMLL